MFIESLMAKLNPDSIPESVSFKSHLYVHALCGLLSGATCSRTSEVSLSGSWAINSYSLDMPSHAMATNFSWASDNPRPIS